MNENIRLYIKPVLDEAMTRLVADINQNIEKAQADMTTRDLQTALYAAEATAKRRQNRLNAIRALHRANDDYPGTPCTECRQAWPCTTARVLGTDEDITRPDA